MEPAREIGKSDADGGVFDFFWLMHIRVPRLGQVYGVDVSGRRPDHEQDGFQCRRCGRSRSYTVNLEHSE